MKKLKLILPTILIGCTALAFTGCGKNEESSSNTDDVVIENEKGVTEMPVSTSTPTPIPSPTEIPLNQKKFEATDNVNVRRTPSTDGDIIDALAPGDKVSVVSIEDDLLMKQNAKTKWYKIKLYEGTSNEIEGYVSTDYVKEVSKTGTRRGSQTRENINQRSTQQDEAEARQQEIKPEDMYNTEMEQEAVGQLDANEDEDIKYAPRVE